MEQRANYMFLVYAERFAFTDNCWVKVVLKRNMSNRECGEKQHGTYVINMIVRGLLKWNREDLRGEYEGSEVFSARF